MTAMHLMPILPWILGVAIVLGYTASLWWLLRRESVPVLLGLLAICGLALSLRLVYTRDFPAGLNEDEVKTLYSATIALQHGRLFGVAFEGPVLLNTLFQAPLVPLFGPNRWAIRTYSLAGSVLAAPVAFAIGRALGLRVIASLATAGFLAVLPWSMFYGRVYFGGEMVFHQLLLLAALAALVCREGGWPEVGMGSLGLCLLMYDYPSGWSMLAMPFAAAVLARGWHRRLLCLVIVVLAVLGWLPFFIANPPTRMWDLGDKLPPGISEGPLSLLFHQTVAALQTLIAPVGRDVWMSVRSAAMHPPLILVLAGLGALTSVRQGLFLWAGFAIGLVPAVVSSYPSSHRILMALPLISLAAGCALDRLPWRRARAAAALIAVVVVGGQSVRHYFSSGFWFTQSYWVFDWEQTAVMEALPPPPHPRFRITPQLMNFFQPLTLVDPDYELLSSENWYPVDGKPAIYAFSQHAGTLRPFYDSLFGFERVEGFGRAFIVKLEGGDWSWLRRHGWSYEARCASEVHTGQVPALHHPPLAFPLWCGVAPATHTWKGRWVGPATKLRLRFSGTAVIETPHGRFEKAGREVSIDFSAEPDMPITVTVAAPEHVEGAGLLEVTPAGERVPPWEQVNPE